MSSLIEIKAPRWRDRTVLVADWKIEHDNVIEITAKRKDGSRFYNQGIRVTGEWLRSYPIDNMPHGRMRVVDLDDLLEQII